MLIEVSAGEIIDKFTILEIKLEKINSPLKLENIKTEYGHINKSFTDIVNENEDVYDFYIELKNINSELWDIEDAIRECERNKDFSHTFVELARKVYKTNDRRSEVKRQINMILNSTIIEEKSYKEY